VAAGLLISFCSWLANKKPILAGFIIALPITTMIALVFSYGEFRDSQKSVEFAQSVFVAVPISLLFFVPFLFAKKFNLHFMTCYGLGFFLLASGYFLHQWLMSRI
jgi:hypothetical protein